MTRVVVVVGIEKVFGKGRGKNWQHLQHQPTNALQQPKNLQLLSNPTQWTRREKPQNGIIVPATKHGGGLRPTHTRIWGPTQKLATASYYSSNYTRFYCCSPEDMKRRLQALSALSTHLVYPCVQSTNIACSLYNCIMFKTKSTSTKLKKSAPLAPFIWHFYVQLLRVTLSKKYPIYFLPSPFLRTVQIFTITRQLALRSTSIFPCPPSFFRYKFLPEHIKYFPCPPSHFPTYKFLPEQIKYLPCPPSIFPMYKFLPEQIK